MQIINPNKSKVTVFDDWVHKEDHWRPGRSAFLLADYWYNGKYRQLIEFINDQMKRSFEDPSEIYPEHKTRFDDYHGPRNHDLFTVMTDETGPLVISIEAKVDEPFSSYLIGDYYSMSMSKKITNNQTFVPERINQLLSNIFSYPYFEDILGIQYQLFPALMGLITECVEKNIMNGLLLIHQFIPQNCDIEKIEMNNNHLVKFIKYLFIGNGRSPFNGNDENYIVGPIRISHFELLNIYLGKFTTIL
jgi:hypothetical protein